MRMAAIALCVAFLLSSSFAAEPVGVVLAVGGFELEGNPVTGNATLFEGSRVVSSAATAELRLSSGARVMLDSHSSGRAYARRLVLESGAGELEADSRFQVEAGGLRLTPEAGPVLARISLAGGRKVQAAVASGLLRVTNPDGILVARMRAGMALEFEPQPPAAGVLPPFEMTGCLERRNGVLVLSDALSGVVEEVRGQGLEREVGNVVEVTAQLIPGAKSSVLGVSEVVQVLRLRRISRGCPAAAAPQPSEAAAAPQPGAPAPAAGAGGMSGGQKAVIAGVVIGGAGAGAAVVLMKKKEDQGTVSR